VPRPFQKKALNTKEENNPDRYCTRPCTGSFLCNARALVLINSLCFGVAC